MACPTALDTTYKPYMSGGKGQDNDKEPHHFQTTDGQQVPKKVAVFYIQVHMPCVMAEPNESMPTSKKPKYTNIPTPPVRPLSGLSRRLK
ncbi:hypothetical protein DSO57_1037320 [Entomophthora muscae]|uniref:Uncharacterized protein n=1 Tax=Entomophthora muscae TaxID=34485 RepID=A0ACC2SNX6_9FUNG|nr:hypothetical protein DSO57_1037320 [Entomophthora muscae]